MGACLSGSKTTEATPPSAGAVKSAAVEAVKTVKAAVPEVKEPAVKKEKLDDTLGLNDDEEEPVRTEPIEDFYQLGSEIGRGGFSVVVEAVEKKDRKSVV